MLREVGELDAAERTVVFVCLHGAAKSIIAAAYLRRLLEDAGGPRAAARAPRSPA